MHRTATFYDLKLTARGVSRAEGKEDDYETDPKSMDELSAHIQQLFQSGDRIVKKGQSDRAAKYYISDMRIQDRKLILLINRSDPTAPDAVSTDPDNKKRLVHEKPPGHGGDYSAHVVINLDPEIGDNYYLCVIETIYGSGLHASSIDDYLRYIIRHCKKQFPTEYLVPHSSGARTPRGKPILVNLVHFLELQGHPSDQFEKDLDSGTLSGIELISFAKEGAVWDEKGGIIEKKRIVELAPQQERLGSISSAVRQLRTKVTKNYQEYPHIRLRFKNEEGEPKDATISVDSGKLVDSNKYVKRHFISAPMVNTTSLETINTFILKEVLALME